MPPTLLLVFVLTFLESVSTTLLQRGVYFYTQGVLKYSQADNLWLALGSGVVYVLGAYSSHAAAARFGERRLLIGILVALGSVHSLLGTLSGSAVLLVGFVVVGGLQGLKWPIVESFVGAGVTPERLLGVLARYNTTWALAVAGAVGISGLLIESSSPKLLFFAPAVINVVAIALCLGLPARPVHLPDEHPARPDPAEVAKFSRLLGSARWSMLSSYALMFVLAPLMPSLFHDLDLGVSEATRAAAMLDGTRVLCFALLGAWAGWRGKPQLLVGIILVLPVSFLMILLGHTLPVVLLGEALFGACGGFAYTAALYYALVVKNASVDAGGAHEALIGLGFAFGPSAGLVGSALSSSFGRDQGLLMAVLPIILVSAIGASYAMLPRRARVGA
jgi:MFS family permease